MKPSNEIWPPPPELETDDTDNDDWLTANDFIQEVTWRDYAVVYFAVVCLLLAYFALAFHHHLPAGAIKSIHHIVRIVLP